MRSEGRIFNDNDSSFPLIITIMVIVVRECERYNSCSVEKRILEKTMGMENLPNYIIAFTKKDLVANLGDIIGHYHRFCASVR